jgi:hypothetical protein
MRTRWTDERREASERWQSEQLGILERKTYAELAALAAKTPLPAPRHLPGLQYYVSRKPGDKGGIEISVRQYTRFLLFESSIGPSFEMLPDGRVIREPSPDEEESVVEDAPWIGRTGLPEDLERELPRYLRREFGESVFDDGSLKAADLVYVGVFTNGSKRVHYWEIASSGNEKLYASITMSPNGSSEISYGDKRPPS